jgi:predicted ATP-grasp superfamily ATP-dependent carboligase
MAITIETRKFKDIDIKGGIILDCIPTVSIVSGIVGTHIVSELNLDQAFALESEQFPPVSMVFSKKPKFPARGYVSEELKLGVVLTEFQPSPQLSRPLAYKLLSCHDEYKCSKIVSFEGLPVQSSTEGEASKNNGSEGKINNKGSDTDDEPLVFGLGSNDHARDLLDAAQITQMETGMVVGVTAILMNEGRWRNRDVISLIGEVKNNISNIRVAARLIEAFNKLFPKFDINVKPLLEEAQKMESHFAKIQAQARPVMDDTAMSLYH